MSKCRVSAVGYGTGMAKGSIVVQMLLTRSSIVDKRMVKRSTGS